MSLKIFRDIFQASTLAVTFCVCFSLNCFAADETKRVTSPYQFQLPSTEGELVQIFQRPTSKVAVICFLGTECPISKLYAPKLKQLAREYASRGVEFIAVNSNVHDSIEECRRYAQDHKLTFPLLKDAGNKVADAYSASRITEVVVIDDQFQLRYRGRIDDQYQPGLSRKKATRNDLSDALEELLSGEKVSVSSTTPFGCIIGRVPSVETTTKLTFANEISRLLQRHCVECHQEGEIAPFSLTDYDEVVGWGEMLVEVVNQKRMPPWHANPDIGHFSNEREMSKHDKELLREWVAGGMPFGDKKDLPPPLESNPVWQLARDPDHVLKMSAKPFEVPADGVVEYQYFVVDPNFEEDVWVTGAQVIPGNRSVVHHAIVFIRPPDGSKFDGIGWLSGYVPGQQPLTMQDGYARLIPAGSKLVFQMHYTPTGTPQSDITKIGLLVGKEKNITHEVVTLIGINQEFEIPPHSKDFNVNGRVKRFPDNGELLAITPHMHLRGKSFKTSVTKKGEEELVLDVPNYDFNWQHFYELKEPLPLKGIERINFTSTFDNSKKNPVNPNPEEYVSWGDQTWEEMAVVFYAVAQPRNSIPTNNQSKQNQPAQIQPAQASGKQDSKVDQFVTDFFARFDKNEDGQIIKDELPLSMRSFGFRRLNRDGNDHLSRDEIERHASRKLKQNSI